MDECVYQCPECNFNADNLTELHNHMDGKILLIKKKKNFSKFFKTNSQKKWIDFHSQTNQSANNKFTSNTVHHEHNQAVDDDEPDDRYIEDDLIYEDDNFNDSYTDNDLYIDAQHDIDHDNENKNYNIDIPLPGGHLSTPLQPNKPQTAARRSVNNNNSQKKQKANALAAAAGNTQPVINSDNHYERQYTCKRCGFFTNNPRAVLYHRKEFHFEKINVHECIYCQYASQYSGKVERHTLLRHKIDTTNTRNF